MVGVCVGGEHLELQGVYISLVEEAVGEVVMMMVVVVGVAMVEVVMVMMVVVVGMAMVEVVMVMMVVVTMITPLNSS